MWCQAILTVGTCDNVIGDWECMGSLIKWIVKTKLAAFPWDCFITGGSVDVPTVDELWDRMAQEGLRWTTVPAFNYVKDLPNYCYSTAQQIICYPRSGQLPFEKCY